MAPDFVSIRRRAHRIAAPGRAAGHPVPTLSQSCPQINGQRSATIQFAVKFVTSRNLWLCSILITRPWQGETGCQTCGGDATTFP